ncbi:MAG: hypothetical protein ACD_81C00200G0002 [uncultured bacterium]|uniref:Cell division FtsK/SpoIIIE n=2 Tax=Candidatus Wolfeibacteriota TaxID=1752735 RepID=A0A0G1K588_9BACT|nr:MAG: hypothetical protein ACD_81C00200G0002 [uncultured bacterium]KKR12190.1 MAG: cell division FtsK/SpoIIIE [Candidatus Wolfebacteria bacterium GW2011_GWC2_39_22]KKT43019.1 MAG: cell division FtsK/SpoIIIE [Candidatus Wolfebacteria bacterium GW2011_GWE2_44_13]HBI25191.1 cell division protein FtsK [Candidatus Wolfebacteria bacterium]
MKPMAKKKTKKELKEQEEKAIAKKRGRKPKDVEAEEEGGGFLPDLRLHPETKKSIWAVILFGVAVILLLAGFQNAGPAGNFLYDIFRSLFGWGYYLLPLILTVMGGVFLTSERRKIYGITFFGAGLFVLSGLGLIDVLSPDNGGFMGKMVGALESLFGYTAAIIVIVIMLIVSFLVTLNLPIRIKREGKEWVVEEEEGVEEESEALKESVKKEEEKAEEIEEETEEEIIVESTMREKIASVIASKPKKGETLSTQDDKDYVFPPLDLLRSSVEKPQSGDLRANANIIKRTLESFGIVVEMGEINVGPKVTRFTLKPAEGVKLSRITALNQDLALALAAHPIRIEAPIPGKSLVGIEVPNKAAAVVRLGSLINYPEFAESGQLSFAVGRDVTGEPMFANIAKMPHLLVAGSTGSGKSVTIHSIILSLLYKNSPKTLRLIMIDPKRVELSVYSGIPHLIAPVVTQSKKSMGVFRWALNEMDRRYEMFEHAGSRDLGSYNKKNPSETLPYVVIVVDELADLMSTYGKEVEGSIVRIAQMARATGIHLILSTQRPSVEVVTGLIKANIPARIALQVASQIDSRTILDMSGAEKLLGGGDMLVMTHDKPKRIQGAFVSEEEIQKVAEFIKEKNKDIMGEEVSFDAKPASEGDGEGAGIFDAFSGNGDEDELLEQAIEVVVQAEKASASLLQRRLKVGYARAARLLDIMEEKGIVGPSKGANPREVFLKEGE